MFGTFERLKQGLKKTRRSLFGRLEDLFRGRVKLDAETLDRLEELLISADLGVKPSMRIVQNIERRLKEEGGEAAMDSVLEVIRADITEILSEAATRDRSLDWSDLETPGGGRKKKGRAAAPAAAPVAPTGGPDVIFVVGVNGTGKTTSIAKLAHYHKEQGRTVLLAAADTFRAAAVEQLLVWSRRVGVECIHQGQGADPAAVVFDALNAAEARGADLVIVDTAGRLHTKTNLMDELGKVARVIRKKLGRDPETLLVIDANTGQNGLQQARSFTETVPVDGLILTKLDGTAKGGIVVAIAEALGLPVRWIGVGEQLGDFAPFEPARFAEALFAAPEDDEHAAS
jgi:fused signal recognition particle receptor